MANGRSGTRGSVGGDPRAKVVLAAGEGIPQGVLVEITLAVCDINSETSRRPYMYGHQATTPSQALQARLSQIVGIDSSVKDAVVQAFERELCGPIAPIR